jgi:TIR domain-containing protein
MSEFQIDDPWHFVREEPVMADVTDSQRDLWTGGLFISHSGEDYKAILERIVRPVVDPRFYGDGLFLHNRNSGGAWNYRTFVRFALRLCDKFFVLVSKNSVVNSWVSAELAWALLYSRPIVVGLLDGTPPSELNPEIGPIDNRVRRSIFVVDFHTDSQAQQKLAAVLDGLLEKFPYPRGVRMADMHGTRRQ